MLHDMIYNNKASKISIKILGSFVAYANH